MKIAKNCLAKLTDTQLDIINNEDFDSVIFVYKNENNELIIDRQTFEDDAPYERIHYSKKGKIVHHYLAKEYDETIHELKNIITKEYAY